MKKKTKIISLAFFTLITLILTTILCSMAFSESEGILPETVFVGDSVAVPSRILTYNGESKTATTTILSPSGGVFGGNEIVAGRAGKYYITYSATFGETTVSESASFTAVRRPEDMFVVNEYATAENYDFAFGGFNYGGVLLTMKNNAEVTFDKIIDVKNNTRTDDFLDFMVVPSAEGKFDFAELVITLTDAEDSDNAVRISVKDGGAENMGGRGSYVKIGANNQTMGGYEYDWYGGRKFLTYFKFGSPTLMSFRGLKEEERYKAMTLGFDYADKSFYVSPASGPYSNVQVCDLDDVSLYGSDVWNGFKSGKIKVSFTVGGLTGASAKVLVGKVCGFDLSAEKYVDETAPEIILEDIAKNPPSSVVGAEYRVFDVIVADDFDDNLTVQTVVKYIRDGNEYSVNVTNGKFVTDYVGKYTITYVATDRSGNKTIKQVTVNCGVVAQDVTITVPQTDVTCKLYDKVVVAGVETVEIYGDGVFDVSMRVVAPNGETAQVTDDVFVPDQTGVYVLTYTATDYVGNAYSKRFNVTVNNLESPVFITEPYLPPAFIYGFNYDLPAIYGYEKGGVAISAKIYVDNAEINDTFTPSDEQAANGKVIVKYALQGESGVADFEKEIKVVSPIVKQGKTKYIDQTAYFITNNAAATMKKDYVSVMFGANGSFTFANKLNSRSASITFACENKTFDNLQVVLSDGADSTKVVTLTITYDDGKYYLSLPNDGNRYNLGKKGEIVGVSYNAANYTVKGVDNVVCGAISKYDDGNEFAGFGDTVYIGMVCNAASDVIVNFTNIVNQTLGHRSVEGVIGSTDRIQPQIVADDDTNDNYAIGDKAKICAVKAFDVLSPVTSVKVTVTAPNGAQVLKNADGTKEHTISLDCYGVYTVKYTATDSYGKNANHSKTIFVKETEKPVLKVNVKKIKATYKIGDAIEIPSYTVTDNSGSYNLDVMLICPDNYVVYLMNDNGGEVQSCLIAENAKLPNGFLVNERTFKPTKSGEYTLRYFAYDEFYNCVTTDVTFVVK